MEEPSVDPQLNSSAQELATESLETNPGHEDELELRVESSQPFIGMWNELVSQTNWEKGSIILKWRESLIEEGAPATAYSDEAWSRMVGGVTSQHVGRLRRVFQRFGEQRESFDNLYWSHFQAALDWDDAELWLEGAVQNRWSISQMRKQRWETLGADPSLKPDDRDIITADIDEDYEPLRSQVEDADRGANVAEGPRPEGPDFGDEEGDRVSQASANAGDPGESIYSEDGAEGSAIDFVRPFENLAELPEDVADAFDAFKLSIIRHKAAGWIDISQADMLGCLDALKELARLPSQDEA